MDQIDFDEREEYYRKSSEGMPEKHWVDSTLGWQELPDLRGQFLLLQGKWVPAGEVDGTRVAAWINDPNATDAILDQCTWNCKMGCWQLD